jgi:hypothetical protein
MPGQIIASPVDAQVHGFIKEQAQRESCTVFHILNKGGYEKTERKNREKRGTRERKNAALSSSAPDP